ncbi:MFS general substrate transporter [Penicillium lagena]|uniref:MFS general substrate transporter n=1 Tax=Penicillium lagena TaxID=94218 RepID=UPI0025418FCF|nr:MFS general substrate transporter [Penicillium lagena]KAJ5620271.1 MFS general substrate transporter [Penicillium lagena]
MAPENVEQPPTISIAEPADNIKSEQGNVIAVSEEARVATGEEHKLGIVKALSTYPKVVMWCMFLCLPIIGIQYDETVMGAYYAMPAFQRRYGDYVGDGEWLVEAKWQAAISMAGYLGQIVGGLSAAAYPLDRFGPRRCLSAGVLGITGCIFIMFFSQSIEVLFVGELLQGLISGSFIVICVSYASELTPLALRGILTSYANLCAVIGQFLGTGVTFALQSRLDQWAYRIPFAVQWWWCLLYFMFIWFAPESPYWLVRKGREEDAVQVLTRLSGRSDSEQDARNRVILMRETDRIEKELSQSATIIDCFRGANLHRTEICVVAYIIQTWGGGALMGYSTLLFELAGLPSKNSFALSLGAKAFSFTGTIVAWFMLSRFGRRTLYCYGEALLTVFLFLIGILAVVPHNLSHPGLQYSQAVMLMLFSFVYDCTIGPVAYVLLGEISSTRLRGKTIAVALAIKAVFGIVNSEAMPYMMNKGHAYWRGKAGFLFGGFNLLFTLWAFMRIPETKGRTFEEIDLLFERGVKAKDFSKYVSDADFEQY